MRTTRREFAAALAAGGAVAGGTAAGGAAAGGAAAQARRPPNILLILADDLGYGDVGCFGQKQIQTPHLDRMASEGMRFTQAYAGNTVCAPSRCCLMTGKHPGHARVRSNHIWTREEELTLQPGDACVAQMLKKAGYATGLVGKWSLGGLGRPGYPTRNGFDYWFGYFGQTHAHEYYPELLLENEHEVLLTENMGTSRKAYAPDLFTERSLRFIDKHRDQPFFLSLCTVVPHTNNELARDTGDGQQVPSDEPYTNRDWPATEKKFAAMITRMDRDVGRILAHLGKLGLDENTVVIFSSDNGPHKAGGHDHKFFRSAGNLRGLKGDLYEGGIRVPTIVRWKGKIKPGSVSDEPWAFWDFFPTAAELAGVPPPAGLDGVSIVPALHGSPLKRDYLYWEYAQRKGFMQAIRFGDWKACRMQYPAPLELYNLKDDPSETRNMASAHPELVKKAGEWMKAAHVDNPDFPIVHSKAER
ncbi:MAG: arylsulfatase [Bryobacterales bacterium]|nr:arylsulfatase [Bryobacterales bacterium]